VQEAWFGRLATGGGDQLSLSMAESGLSVPEMEPGGELELSAAMPVREMVELMGSFWLSEELGRSMIADMWIPP
jgi:hypothetical protein